MSRAVVQAISGTCPCLDLSAPFAMEYARRVGAEYVQERMNNAPEHGAFAKLALDRQCARHDMTLWIDADVICLPDAPDIFEVAPKDCITAFAHEGALHQNESGKWPMFDLAGHGTGYCNTGVMVWPRRAAGLVRDALEICRNGRIKHIPKARWFFEQTALNLAISDSKIPVHDLDYRFNCYIDDREIMDRWPDDPLLHPLSEAHFVHFAGGAHTPQGYYALQGDRHSQEERAEHMEIWLRKKGLL